jgi:hypothetical protein
MGQFLRVNGDYNIRAGDGAKITLDTGPAASGGSVRVTGNLVVEGDTFNVNTTNLNVEDNIISLNVGEVGPGVSLIYSGIEIQRGDTSTASPQNNASFLYDESTDSWILAHGTAPGPFNFDASSLRLKQILTNSTTDSGDLTLIGTGTGVVKVIGTINYEDQVTHDDDLPNKKYVDDSILNNPTFQIVAPQNQDTRVIITDKDITPDNDPNQPGSLAYFTDTTTYSTNNESAVSIIVDGVLVSQFYNDRLLVGDPGVDGIEIDGTNFEIRTEVSIIDQNIFIKTAGTGKLQTNYAMQLEKIGTVPALVSNNVLLYAAASGIGTTGVYFVNDSAEAAKQNGELISKNKALVFSMLF